jgi:FkbM family methyltransferase
MTAIQSKQVGSRSAFLKDARRVKAKTTTVFPSCAACGTRALRRNANVEWNVRKQQWEIANISDTAMCEACGTETRLTETPTRTDRSSHSHGRRAHYKVVDLREFYKVWEEEHLRKLLPHYDVDCIFDVGANYGQYAQMLRHRAGFTGLIISFEPISDAAAALREKANGDKNWIIEEEALAAHNGKRPFNVMRCSEFSSLSMPRHDDVDIFRDWNKVEESITVKTETLTKAYRRLKKTYNFQRPFLKLDTQGYDLEIVTHAKPVISEFIGLQSELAIKKLYETSIDFREALTIYEQCGFALSAFVPNNAGHFPRLIEIDCIMVRADLLNTKPQP